MKRVFNKMSLRFVPFLFDISREPELDWYEMQFFTIGSRSLASIRIEVWRDEDPGRFISVEFLFFRMLTEYPL